ncbi:MAG: nucleotidyltransferase domain-containing protein [Nanoarchaeota archaeon]
MKIKKKKVINEKDLQNKKIITKNINKKDISKENSPAKKQTPTQKKFNPKNIPSLKLKSDADIALDFSTQAYKKFNQSIKAIILFGSTAKQTNVAGSDIDLIILIDDVSIKWTRELIAWYREELDKILMKKPYRKSLHINTVKLSTWWEDLMRGDPVVINILRYGQAVLDFAGFFNPLKFLLLQGKIRSTPEAIYNCLERAPTHILRSRVSELNAIEGLYWSMVDSAHAALIAKNILPPSPEHIFSSLTTNFVMDGKLKQKYVDWFKDLLILHKKIAHGEITDLKGVEIDMWQERSEEFLRIMAKLVEELIQ